MLGGRGEFIWRKRAERSWLARNEAAIAHLSGGQHAIVDQAGRKHLIVEVFCSDAEAANPLRKQFGGAVFPLPNDWRQGFLQPKARLPLRIGQRLTIVAADAQRGNRSQLIIPAGAAFGTGEHVTTAMSLRLVEKCSRCLNGAWSFLDAGTGSGILALAAARLGAKQIVAVENDPIALRTARANATANCIRRVRFIKGDATRMPARGAFDIVAANLFSELVIAALPLWQKRLKRGGSLIVSGVLRGQEREVTTALRRHNFIPLKVRRRGKWIALLATQKPG